MLLVDVFENLHEGLMEHIPGLFAIIGVAHAYHHHAAVKALVQNLLKLAPSFNPAFDDFIHCVI